MAARTFDRSRLRLGIVIAVIAGALVLLLIQVGKATVFDRDADWVVAHRDKVGTKTFRLQGIVLPGSIKENGSGLDFTVEYHCATVPVHHQGTQPALLKDGIPVVGLMHVDDLEDYLEMQNRSVKEQIQTSTAEYRRGAARSAHAFLAELKTPSSKRKKK